MSRLLRHQAALLVGDRRWPPLAVELVDRVPRAAGEADEDAKDGEGGGWLLEERHRDGDEQHELRVARNPHRDGRGHFDELLMYEALGIAREGQGFEVLRDGVTALDGEVPVNTGGGLLGFGHPVGATGVKQVVEIFKQLRGQAGDYQIPSSPQYGISANMGGDDRTGVAIVQRRCG